MTGKRNLNLVNKKVTGNWHQRSVYRYPSLAHV